MCHRCFTRLTGQGLTKDQDRRNAAVSVPVAWRPSPVRAAASGTCSWTTRPWPDAGQRWRAPGSGPPTSASLVRARMAGAWRAAALALPPHVPLAASEHNQMSWPPTTTRRGPGMRHGGSACSSPRGPSDRPGRRPAARRALVGGRPVRRGAAGTALAAADLRRPAPRQQGTRCAHRGTCPDRRAAARLPGRRRPRCAAR
jgi:hypothetical protein